MRSIEQIMINARNHDGHLSIISECQKELLVNLESYCVVDLEKAFSELEKLTKDLAKSDIEKINRILGLGYENKV